MRSKTLRDAQSAGFCRQVAGLEAASETRTNFSHQGIQVVLGTGGRKSRAAGDVPSDVGAGGQPAVKH